MRSGRTVLILIVVALPILLLASGALAWRWLFGGTSQPYFEREPSPDGRYEVVRETTAWLLDSYERLWLTTTGEQDRKQWFPIAPEVDGTWDTEWLSPVNLMVTDHGAWPETRQPYRLAIWRDVRIETRPRPLFHTVDSPDQLHCLDVWTYDDTRGRRSAAMLCCNWQNPNPGGITLIDEGPWRIAASWVSNDHLDLEVERDQGTELPAVLPHWRAITITVHAK